MNFCTKCGSKLESTKFCTNCGSPIEHGASTIATPSPKFDTGGITGTAQSGAHAPKAHSRAPTCIECGKPVANGQFLCGGCTLRKAQPKNHAPADQQIYYSPPSQKSNWFVRLLGGVGVAYLCWLGFSAILVNNTSSPADPVPGRRSATLTSPTTLDSAVRPEMNKADRQIDTIIGAWRYKVLEFEGRFGFYDPWQQNAACKPDGEAVPYLLILVQYSGQVMKTLGDLSGYATASGKASASSYQQEIREKFPLFFDDGWKPSAPNLPNNPNDHLPTNTRDYGDLLR